ncbi:aminoglycoside phosphotransferase family protein [Streptomyces sp. NPDC059524]|uniref:aminoglycoside phosphotransferase family protein n=1 Tax=Streptomyces sp. NPDC059524 TaxID=3346856 RepID=UPI0036914EC5
MPPTPHPTDETVRRVLRSLLPDRGATAEVRPVEAPGAGGAGVISWWVGDRHVLRFALDTRAGQWLRREVRLRDLVRPHLPLALPAGVAAGEWAPGLVCVVETRVPGEPARIQDVTALGEEDLAGLLTGLRAVPVERAVPLGVPTVAPRSLENVRREAGAAAQRLDEQGEFDAARLRQFTARAVAQLGPQSGAALIHHGLTEERLRVSADGHVRGVLGWGDAVIGDVAEDIAGLVVSVGARAAVRAATLAGCGARICLRGLWLGRCDALVGLDAGAETGRWGRGVERAWEPILLELVSE